MGKVYIAIYSLEQLTAEIQICTKILGIPATNIYVNQTARLPYQSVVRTNLLSLSYSYPIRFMRNPSVEKLICTSATKGDSSPLVMGLAAHKKPGKERL